MTALDGYLLAKKGQGRTRDRHRPHGLRAGRGHQRHRRPVAPAATGCPVAQVRRTRDVRHHPSRPRRRIDADGWFGSERTDGRRTRPAAGGRRRQPGNSRDPVTFGNLQLYDGIPFLAALIGTFAISEMLLLVGSDVVQRRQREQSVKSGGLRKESRDAIAGVKATLAEPGAVVRSSGIGILLGDPRDRDVGVELHQLCGGEEAVEEPGGVRQGQSQGIIKPKPATTRWPAAASSRRSRSAFPAAPRWPSSWPRSTCRASSPDPGCCRPTTPRCTSSCWR